jgi:MFS family permease
VRFVGEYARLPSPVYVLCVGTLLSRAGSFVLIFLTIYLSEQLELGVAFATQCVGALGIGSMAGGLLGGQLADQFGRRTVMLASLFGGALLLLVLSSLHSPLAILLTVAAFAAVMDMYRPAAAAMMADLVDPARRPQAFSLMYVAMNLGFAISPPLGGLLARHSFQLLFWVDAATTAAYGLVILLLIRETLPRLATPGWPPPAASEPGRQQPGPPERAANAGIGFWRAFGRILGDGPLLRFFAASVLTGIVFVQGFSTLPIYFRQLGYNELQFGLMIAINGVLIVLLQLPMTHWLARFRRPPVVICGEAIVVLGFGLTAWAAGTWQLAATIVVWTLGEIIQAPFKHSIVADLSPPELRGRCMGLLALSFSVALAIGAPLGGAVLDRFGPQTLWLGCGVLGAAALAIYASAYQMLCQRLEAPAVAADTACPEPPEPPEPRLAGDAAVLTAPQGGQGGR